MKQKGSFLVGRQIKSGALKKMDSTMRQWVLSRQLSSLKEGIMLVCFFSGEQGKSLVAFCGLAL